MAVKFKVIRTFDRKKYNFSSIEVVHIKTGQTVYSVLGDDKFKEALTMADQLETDPEHVKFLLKLNTKVNKYA